MADAMQKHTPHSITGIILRPQTGEILAMASMPITIRTRWPP